MENTELNPPTLITAAASAEGIAPLLEAHPDSEATTQLRFWAAKIAHEWAPGATVPEGRYRLIERALSKVLPELRGWSLADTAALEVTAATRALRDLGDESAAA